MKRTWFSHAGVNWAITAQGLLLAMMLVTSLASTTASAAGSAQAKHESEYEPEVLAILSAIRTGELESALVLANEHVAQFPKSRIGHLLKADILQAMSTQLTEVGQVISSPERGADETDLGAKSTVLQGLKHQIKNRWRHLQENHSIAEQRVPSSLVDMGRHEFVIVTDMQEGRLYLYKNNRDGAVSKPELVHDYYLSVGSAGYGKEVEGDNKTPVGVYSIYRYINPNELPDLYGDGAFPVDYPNKFDRSKKRTGYGIWLHGTPSDTYARSPWASEGCFVLSNDDLLHIGEYIDVKKRTPVILSDAIEWVEMDALLEQRVQYYSLLSGWKDDWESLNTDAYLEHYSQQNFNFGDSDFSSWAERKQEVNQDKTFIQIDMDINSLFVYPGEKDLFVVNYTQRYLSNNYAGETAKQQYWQRDKGGRWKIIYEG